MNKIYTNLTWIISPTLKIFDFWTTKHIIDNNGQELNPFMNELFIRLGMFYSFFLAFSIIFLLSVVFKLIYDKNVCKSKCQKFIIFGYFVFCTMNLFPVLFNLQ